MSAPTRPRGAARSGTHDPQDDDPRDGGAGDVRHRARDLPHDPPDRFDDGTRASGDPMARTGAGRRA